MISSIEKIQSISSYVKHLTALDIPNAKRSHLDKSGYISKLAQLSGIESTDGAVFSVLALLIDKCIPNSKQRNKTCRIGYITDLKAIKGKNSKLTGFEFKQDLFSEQLKSLYPTQEYPYTGQDFRNFLAVFNCTVDNRGKFEPKGKADRPTYTITIESDIRPIEDLSKVEQAKLVKAKKKETLEDAVNSLVKNGMTEKQARNLIETQVSSLT